MLVTSIFSFSHVFYPTKEKLHYLSHTENDIRNLVGDSNTILSAYTKYNYTLTIVLY